MNGYRSRKFIVTMTVIVASTLLAYFGKIDPNLAIIFAACVSVYNWANVQHAIGDSK